MMKTRTHKILLTSFALACLAACSKTGDDSSRTISATFDSGMAEEVSDCRWNAGDKIWITDGTNTETYSITTADLSNGKKNASIKTSLQGTLYAVFPASAVQSTSGRQVVIDIPESQDGTFRSANICVASSSGTSMTFNSAVAIVRCSGRSAEIDGISLSSTGISGSSDLYLSASTACGQGSSDAVSVGPLSGSGPYYFALAPTTLEAGTVFYYMSGTEKKGQRTLDSAASLEAGKIFELGEAGSGNITPGPVDVTGETVAQLIDKGKSFSLTASLVGKVTPQDSDHWVAQGGASDGEYVYFTLRTSTSVGEDADQRAVIYKYTLSPFEFVAKSAAIACGHTNDITYNPNDKTLVIAHGNKQSKVLTTVNASDLTVHTQSVSIESNCGGISYNSSKKQYLMNSGKANFWIADLSFKKLFVYNRTDGSEATSQGNGCDGTYAYFPMSVSGNTSVVPTEIEVYTWDGKYVRRLYVYTDTKSLEIENVFFANDKMYGVFFPGSSVKGAYLYELVPTGE